MARQPTYKINAGELSIPFVANYEVPELCDSIVDRRNGRSGKYRTMFLTGYLYHPRHGAYRPVIIPLDQVAHYITQMRQFLRQAAIIVIDNQIIATNEFSIRVEHDYPTAAMIERWQKADF